MNGKEAKKERKNIHAIFKTFNETCRLNCGEVGLLLFSRVVTLGCLVKREREELWQKETRVVESQHRRSTTQPRITTRTGRKIGVQPEASVVPTPLRLVRVAMACSTLGSFRKAFLLSDCTALGVLIRTKFVN